MSLTQERINDIAIECWQKVGSTNPITLCNLFLSCIREEQEAVALAAVHPDGFLHSAMIIERNLDVIDAWDKAKINTIKLFTIPPASQECKMGDKTHGEKE